MEDGAAYELVGGVLVPRHGWGDGDEDGGRVGLDSNGIALEIVLLLQGHFPKSRWVRVVPASGGFRCFADDPDKVRKPDAAFIRREHLPGGRLPELNSPVPADFAIEVRSPSDGVWALRGKCRDYRENGFDVVWAVDPQRRVIDIYDAEGERQLVGGAQIRVPGEAALEVEVNALLDAATPDR